MRPEIWDVTLYFPKYGKDVAKTYKIGQKPRQKTSQGVAGRRRTSQGVAENVAGRRRNVAGVAENVAGRRRTSQGVAGVSQARFLAKTVVFKSFWPKLRKTLIGASFRHTFRAKVQIYH